MVEADRHAMQAADKSTIGGTKMVPIAIPYPSEIGGVKVAHEIDKERPTRNARIVDGKATMKVSARRRGLIQTKPDQAGKTRLGVIDCTSLEAWREPSQDRPS